jgi:hypothetical protein
VRLKIAAGKAVLDRDLRGAALLVSLCASFLFRVKDGRRSIGVPRVVSWASSEELATAGRSVDPLSHQVTRGAGGRKLNNTRAES